LEEINRQVARRDLVYGSEDWREAMSVVEELGIKAT
jgi:hypothetical protein